MDRETTLACLRKISKSVIVLWDEPVRSTARAQEVLTSAMNREGAIMDEKGEPPTPGVMVDHDDAFWRLQERLNVHSITPPSYEQIPFRFK